jgi:hypothetical protein
VLLLLLLPPLGLALCLVLLLLLRTVSCSSSSSMLALLACRLVAHGSCCICSSMSPWQVTGRLIATSIAATITAAVLPVTSAANLTAAAGAGVATSVIMCHPCCAALGCGLSLRPTHSRGGGSPSSSTSNTSRSFALLGAFAMAVGVAVIA